MLKDDEFLFDLEQNCYLMDFRLMTLNLCFILVVYCVS